MIGGDRRYCSKNSYALFAYYTFLFVSLHRGEGGVTQTFVVGEAVLFQVSMMVVLVVVTR